MSALTQRPATQNPLPRGADWSKLHADPTRAVDDAGSPTRLQYAGLPVMADGLDVHEAAMDLLKRHAPTTARVADVGAGSGAFTQRMIDNGYRNVEAIEVNAKAFRVPNVPVHPINLDEKWAAQLSAPFDAVVALEVIEHLENPWQFGRECAAAVKPGGTLIVSTPNIQSSRSRLQFLLKAEFRFFTQRDFEQMGHMSSLTHRQIEQIYSCAGCEMLEASHSAHKGVPRPTSGRKILSAIQYLASYPFMKGGKWGEVCMFAFRRTK